MNKLRNFLGGFADAAVLLPIVVLLVQKVGFDGTRLLISAGVVYIASAWFFKVPMAVQPLKSIAISAVALSASLSEVRVAAVCLGVFCLTLSLGDVESWAKRVPIAIVHQIQVGLGVLLIYQGFKIASQPWIALLAVAAFLFPSVKQIPVMGLIAFVGFVGASFFEQSVSVSIASDMFRPGLVLSLLLPQLALTLSNSVLGTRNACETYFGERAERVTLKNLLRSIGLGNCVSAAVGGLPFCHGAGGVTAHVKGGSTQSWSTAVFGVLLISCSWMTLVYPPALIAFLLMTTGLFHLQLGISTAKYKLAVAVGVTLFTQNLLWVLAAAILGEILQHAFISRSLVRSQARW